MRNLISTQRVACISHLIGDLRANTTETLRAAMNAFQQMWREPGYPGVPAMEPLTVSSSFAGRKSSRFLRHADHTCHGSMR